MADMFGIDAYKKEAEELNAKNYEVHYFMYHEQKKTNEILKAILNKLS